MKAMGGLTALPSRVGVAALLAAIWVYQRTVSPLIGPVCRFQPSCSRYMAESLRKYGLVRGLGMREFLVGEEAKTLAELQEIIFD